MSQSKFDERVFEKYASKIDEVMNGLAYEMSPEYMDLCISDGENKIIKITNCKGAKELDYLLLRLEQMMKNFRLSKDGGFRMKRGKCEITAEERSKILKQIFLLSETL